MAARIRRRPLGPTVVLFVVMCIVAGIAIGIRQQRPVEAAPGPGPYDVAQVVDTNPDPNIVETDITAFAKTLDVGNGVLANMWTFNGTVPGPQFRLKVGDTVIVHFKNLLPEPTSIHWHGIELANTSDGTPVTQNQVETNDTFLYKFTVTRPGIFWYHPHHHASTNHVFRGLYGSIIVTDNANHEATLVANGVLPSAAQTKTLELSDTTVCAASDPAPPCADPLDHNGAPIVPVVPLAAGEIPNIQPVFDRVDEGRTVLTNGVNVGARAGTPTSPGALDASATTLDVQAGQGLRLQLIDAATIRFFTLVLTDDSGTPITLFRVGGEGGLLDKAIVEGGVIGGYDTGYLPGEIVLAPGDRADVVAVIPPSATGVLTLWTKAFPADPSGPGPATAPVAHFKVNGTASSPYTISDGTPLLTDPRVNAPVEVLPAPTASLLDPSTFSPAKPGLAAPNIEFTETGNLPSGFGVDHVQGTHDSLGDYTNIRHMGSTRYAKIGDVLELTVVNEFNFLRHPFHLHGFSIQPISFTPWPGANAPIPTASFTFPYHEFIDEIEIPAKYMLTFRVRLDPRPLIDGVTPGGGLGRWMFHCHLFHHSTFGLVSEFDVVGADGNEVPYVNADNTPVAAKRDTTITNTGTWMDPDGDPVTLSASIGTVVKDPGGVAGTWSWTFTAPADAPRLVFITATDAGGHKNQAAFALDLDTSPVVPSPPLRVTASASAAPSGALVSFLPPDDDGGRTIFGFTATCASSNGGRPGSVSGATSPIIVTGLTGGFSYSCWVTAANAIGTSLPSTSAGPVVVPLMVPGAARSVWATAGAGRATVHWRAPAGNESPIIGYVVTPVIGLRPSPGRVFNNAATTQVIVGLTNGTTYRFRVAATNAAGTGAASPASGTIRIGAPAAPARPTAARISAGSLKVAFGAPARNGAPITSYTAACRSANGGAAKSKKAAAVPISVTGLTAGKTYTCTVSATNSRGTGPWSPASAPARA